MKKLFTSIIFFLVCLFAVNTYAQVSRSNAKSSVAYRTNYQRISTTSDSYNTFEIREGSLWAWGHNIYGQLGDGTTTNRNGPVQIGTDDTWIIISQSQFHTLGLKSDGTLWSWGRNNYGQLGDSALNQRSSPVQIGTETKWISIHAGYGHSLALKSDGTLWVWGLNTNGQLGDGTMTNKNVPVQIGTDHNWVSVCTGLNHSYGLKSDGTLWAWGRNDFNQLGDGTNIQRITPVQIGSDNNWRSITGGSHHGLGIKSDGTLWAWGRNFGQLGDGTLSDISNPIQIGTDNNWTSVSTGWRHTLGIKSDGTLWSWGKNYVGQLGDGTTLTTTVPNQVGSDNNWVTLWAWGWNLYGQLGDGTTANKYIPIQIGTDNNWIRIVAGNYHSHGLKSDGTLLAWGGNISGEFGNGTNANQSNPIQIGADNNWVSINTMGVHLIGLKSDRTAFCATGNNIYGQLGDGTTVDKNTFTCNTNCVTPPAPNGSNASICYNTTATLSATGTGILEWYSQPTGGTYLGSGSNYLTPALTSNTTYYVQDSTCTVSPSRKAILVTVNPLPYINYHQSPSVVCNNNSSFPLGPYSPGGVFSGPSVNGPYFNAVTAGTGTVAIVYTITDANSCTNTATSIITVNICAGITSSNNTNAFNVFPNPTSGSVFIQFVDIISDGKLCVYDVLGNCLNSERIKNAIDFKLDLSRYDKGTYFIELQVDKERIHKKIVID